MAVSQWLRELVRAAQDTAKLSSACISQILDDLTDQFPTDAQTKELAELKVVIELVAVDIFKMFEARMHQHFKRDPLSRQVKAVLLEAKEPRNVSTTLRQWPLEFRLGFLRLVLVD